jgi:para-nitrobenzyl esterase
MVLRSFERIRKTLFLAFGLAVLAGAAARAQEAPALELAIDAGKISGAALEDGVRVYRGIPFAKPPVGALRWRPPEPVAPWEGVRRCVEFGPSCPQPASLIGNVPGKESEDCLYLNVWTGARTPADRLPVMVWIHGGSHTTGAGSVPTYDGADLARQGVVLVTINYRLGPFGNFAHPLLSAESEHHSSGNYGLEDEIAALGWVKKNVAAFGGDPSRVTIFGESAGAQDVTCLLVSPLAKGLFQRAIAESGTAMTHLRRLAEQESVGEKIAKDLHADSLALLREKSADEILAAAKPTQGFFAEGNRLGPLVDGWCLPEDPGELVEAGKTAHVPVLTGTNADEGTIFTRPLPVKHKAGYELLARRLYGDQAAAVLALFPVEKDADLEGALDAVTRVSAFVAPARRLVRAVAKAGDKAWLYEFTRVPAAAKALSLGAFHGLEIRYVFANLDASKSMRYEAADRALSKVMSALWVRFATTGDPNGEGLPAWPAYDAKKDEHLELGDTVKTGSGLDREACDLFDAVERARHSR